MYSEKCTPQQARVEIKTQLKPANKPKVKVNKVTIPSDTRTLFIFMLLTTFKTHSGLAAV
jgi:hypothetical protein